MKLFIGALMLCIGFLASCSRSAKVPLNNLTHLDKGMEMLDIFKKEPVIQVPLPSVDTTGARFIKFYSFWKKDKGPWVVIMIVPKGTGDELYIDHNYNNDLTDDGPPHFFPKSDNEFIYEMVNNEDKDQFIRLAYSRTPRDDFSRDSEMSEYVDSAYNLSPEFLKDVRFSEQSPDFDGTLGSFYWIDRLDTHRGTVELDGVKYDVGLCDWTYNGLYDDVVKVNGRDYGDRLYIDLEHQGRLERHNPNHFFYVKDTFTIGSKNYRLKGVDRYGSWIELVRVEGDTTVRKRIAYAPAATRPLTPSIDTSWQLVVSQAIDGTTIRLKEYRGKYLLLNFWGEWCSGCRQEIPALKNAIKRIPASKLQIISYVYTANLEQAKSFVKDSSITWPQIHLSKEMQEKYKIYGFPTNILISPDGRKVIRTWMVGDKFFEDNIH